MYDLEIGKLCNSNWVRATCTFLSTSFLWIDTDLSAQRVFLLSIIFVLLTAEISMFKCFKLKTSVFKFQVHTYLYSMRGPNMIYIPPARVWLTLGPWGFALGLWGFLMGP